MIEKRYHIYVNDKCIYHSLKESEFEQTWTMLNQFVELATDISRDSLQYEEVVYQKDITLNSSY